MNRVLAAAVILGLFLFAFTPATMPPNLEELVVLQAQTIECVAGIVGMRVFGKNPGQDYANVVVYYVKPDLTQPPAPVLWVIYEDYPGGTVQLALLKLPGSGVIDKFHSLSEMKETYPMLSGPCGLLIKNYGA